MLLDNRLVTEETVSARRGHKVSHCFMLQCLRNTKRCCGKCTSLGFLSHSVPHTRGPKSALGTEQSTYCEVAHGNMDNTGLHRHLCHIVGLALQPCE